MPERTLKDVLQGKKRRPPDIWSAQDYENAIKRQQARQKDWKKYTHWPNPFTALMKSLHITACEHTWQALVEFYGLSALEFFFTTLVPSPVEITRKATMGNYKCGLYFLPKQKSPLDLIWVDGSASRALVEIARPATTAIFYWWAAETAYLALNTTSTLMLAGEFCDLEGNECLLRDGDLPIPGSAHDFEGAAALYEEIYDPNNRYPQLGYFIEFHNVQAASVMAVGYIAAGPSSMSNVSVGIRWNTEEPEWVFLGNVGEEKVVKFSVSSSKQWTGSNFVSVWFKGHRDALAVLPNSIHVDRFTAKCTDASPPDYPNFNAFPFKEPLLKNCWQKYWADEL